MKLNINMNDICISNIELLEMLERALRLNYDHSYIQNGVVYQRSSNNEVFIGFKTDTPEEVYHAYVTIRKYLLNEEERK